MASPKGKRSRSENMKLVNERRRKDKAFDQRCQDKATEGKQNSEKFKQAGRDTLNRLRYDPDFQKAHSKAAAERAKRFGIASCRRSIPVRYTDRKGREFRFRSLLECRFAILADLTGLDWEYEPVSLPYKWGDRTRHYVPDFWLPDRQQYVEVKGYETEGVRDQLAAVRIRNPQANIRLWTSADAELDGACPIDVDGPECMVEFADILVTTGG